jgi:hypothetical protein
VARENRRSERIGLELGDFCSDQDFFAVALQAQVSGIAGFAMQRVQDSALRRSGYGQAVDAQEDVSGQDPGDGFLAVLLGDLQDGILAILRGTQGDSDLIQIVSVVC